MEPLAVSPCTLGPIELSTVYSWYFSQTCSGVTSGKMMFLENKSTWITSEKPTNKGKDIKIFLDFLFFPGQ